MLGAAEAWRDEPCIAANDRASRMWWWGHLSSSKHAASARSALPCHHLCRAMMRRVLGRAAADAFWRDNVERGGASVSVTTALSFSVWPDAVAPNV
jgi:hypothetical protein